MSNTWGKPGGAVMVRPFTPLDARKRARGHTMATIQLETDDDVVIAWCTTFPNAAAALHERLGCWPASEPGARAVQRFMERR